ncbi:MAG TPA: pyridoxal phosphate-dependent aminotransferase [Gemmataceae bacterium]|nr:pyridoxal phosphate-dependent aminotransferase [Gemmataceae bacterium]
MRDFFLPDHPQDPAEGLTRRDFARLAALLAAGATLPFYNEFTLAQDIKAIANIPPDAVKLNANENPLGPCAEALETIRKIAPNTGRYLFRETFEFVETMAASEGLSTNYVLPSAGSSDPLHRAVLAFTSPSRPLITAEPGYEAPQGAARFNKAKIIKVPLRKDYSHDAKEMATAHPDAGLIFVCNPNNPTGTVTRKEDIDAIVANKPKGCVVLVDEAYIHFSDSARSATDLVLAGKDVIVLRTFSKLYGMAGLRAGAALGRPDLLEKMRALAGLNFLPATAMVAATASLKNKGLVAQRRQSLAEVRKDLFAWLDRKGYSYIPSEANMVLIDSKRPGRETAKTMLQHKVAIGRSWAALPTHVRVTIGTAAEMEKFKAAFERAVHA